jgi:hypothetical protein
VTTVRTLAALLAVEVALIWHLAHQPLSPSGLVCWPMALYTLGWTLYTLWEQATTPAKRHPTSRRR